MKIIKTISALILIIGLVFCSPMAIGATDASGEYLAGACKYNTVDAAACKDTVQLDSVAKNIISTLAMFIGIAAVATIIYAGITFVSAGGSQEKIKLAKNMIIYAMIGIVVSILAQAIVTFVLGKF